MSWSILFSSPQTLELPVLGTQDWDPQTPELPALGAQDWDPQTPELLALEAQDWTLRHQSFQSLGFRTGPSDTRASGPWGSALDWGIDLVI